MGELEDGKRSRRSDKAYAKWLEGIALGVTRTERYIEEIQEERPTLVEVRIKCDPDDDRGVLLIIKGYVGSQDYVAFHRDTTYSTALAALGNRLRNGSLNWREDEGYVDKRTGDRGVEG